MQILFFWWNITGLVVVAYPKVYSAYYQIVTFWYFWESFEIFIVPIWWEALYNYVLILHVIFVMHLCTYIWYYIIIDVDNWSIVPFTNFGVIWPFLFSLWENRSVALTRYDDHLSEYKHKFLIFSKWSWEYHKNAELILPISRFR